MDSLELSKLMNVILSTPYKLQLIGFFSEKRNNSRDIGQIVKYRGKLSHPFKSIKKYLSP